MARPSFGLHTFAVLALCCAACESSEQEANETALLLQRVQGYTDADEAEQAAELAALRQFHPSTARVREARDVCLDAYTLVERAEEQHADAQRMLEQVTQGRAELATTRPRIEELIKRSGKAIDGAKPAINRCTRLLSDLKREQRR